MDRDVEKKNTTKVVRIVYQTDYQGNVNAERLTGTRGIPGFQGTQSVYHTSTVFTNLVNTAHAVVLPINLQ